MAPVRGLRRRMPSARTADTAGPPGRTKSGLFPTKNRENLLQAGRSRAITRIPSTRNLQTMATKKASGASKIKPVTEPLGKSGLVN
ncbi:MAG TPA: hypothetical protein VIG88_13250, partial [Lysobacter sp.]